MSISINRKHINSIIKANQFNNIDIDVNVDNIPYKFYLIDYELTTFSRELESIYLEIHVIRKFNFIFNVYFKYNDSLIKPYYYNIRKQNNELFPFELLEYINIFHNYYQVVFVEFEKILNERFKDLNYNIKLANCLKPLHDQTHEAIKIMFDHNMVSTSLIQQKLLIKRSIAEKIMSELSELGAIELGEGTKPGKFLITNLSDFQTLLTKNN